jgi:hypothetical protein
MRGEVGRGERRRHLGYIDGDAARGPAHNELVLLAAIAAT